jgi:hypothetical protein
MSARGMNPGAPDILQNLDLTGISYLVKGAVNLVTLLKISQRWWKVNAKNGMSYDLKR